MYMNQSGRIIVAITAGIAAYKSAFLVRELVKHGFEVQVVMTEGAKAFIQPLTLQALSGKSVRDSLLDPQAELGMGHIELARWADLIVVAPATADMIARAANGLANDLLSTLCLAARCPVAFVPAMNEMMWQHPATQKNLRTLQTFSPPAENLIWGPAEGPQACGDVGPGRMLEPEDILARVQAFMAIQRGNAQPLYGQKVVVTAGPTREAIDPVRYISNHSSGKMGYAVASAFCRVGAEVVLISGPTQLPCPAGVTRVDVVSAQEMHAAAMAAAKNNCAIFVASAAVADYRPDLVADQKIKKTQDAMAIQLVKNPDIVSDVAALENKPFTVGFAAETQAVETYARDKLQRKNLDMIVANDVSVAGIGFNSDDNAAMLIWPDGQESCPQQSKASLAESIVMRVLRLMGHELPKIR